MMILQWRLPMVMWSFFLIYGMCFIFVFSTKTEFRIAWMAPKKEYYNLSAYSSVGALKIALSAIRRNPTNRIQSLHNSTIKVRWYDTDCNAKSALAAAVDAKSKFDPHLFLGPPCSVGMKGVALLASQWKTPVFGWVSQEEEFQDKKMYSTLVRFLGPLNRFPNVMFHLQSLFKWSQFSVVYDKRDPYRAVAEALYEKKSIENMDSSMNWYNIVNSFKVSNDMSDKQIEEIFRQIKKYSRIVVMALPWLDMRKYMLVAHKLGMSDGDYAFLCIHGDLYTYDRMETDVFSDLVWRKNDSYDSIAKDAFEPVFHVMMKPLEKTHWNLFKKIASDITSSTDPNWNLPEPPEEYIPPDAYAPYLYDATLVWAILADKILKENKNPHDGEYMFLKATTLTDEVEVDGLTGKVNLDNHGDRNLNFQVLDMTENGTFESILTIKYQNKMMQVEFVNNKTEENLSRWPNGKVGIKYAPPDEPIYGFDGKKCPEQDEQPDRTFIYVFSAGGVVFVVVVATILYCILKMTYDDVYRMIGSCGRYQKLIYVLQTLPVMFAAVQTYLSVFILYVPDHRCSSLNSISTTHAPQDIHFLSSRCKVYYNIKSEFLYEVYNSPESSNWDNLTMPSSECRSWEYDTALFENTFVTQKNLVCKKKLYRTHAIVAYMAGFTLGSLGMGIFSDKFGRKVVLMASIALYIGSSIPLSFVNEFSEFTVSRIFSGVSVGGLLNTCYVMDLELVEPRMRMLAGMVYMLFWATGALLLTGMAYLIRDWRNLNLSLALPTILFLFYKILVPESTRWLFIKGRRKRAENILRMIARRNNRSFKEPILPDEDEEAQRDEQRVSFIAFCSYPRLLCNTFVIFFNWFVVSLVFFGLSWNVSNLGDDVFLNFYLTSIAQIVGFLLCIPLLNGVGRKPVYVGSLFMGGVALLLTIFPVKYGSSGMAGSSMAVATLFLYSTELFPTVVRNSGLGIANLCACIGGIIAPYIPDLNKIVSGDIGRILPMSIFGIFAIIAGLLSLLLPETNKPRLPETLGDAVLQNEGHTHRDMEMVTVIQPLKETPENSLTLH
ncbi:uncharacterized protein [Magallana gigas]|uniref:uncharacterized protein isoform X3 n=1 Tax=Magallana gigas TaxID=29159 RepID=UPI0033416CAB